MEDGCLHITGNVGVLYVGAEKSIILSNWGIDAGPYVSHFQGKLARVDNFLVTQRPTRLSLHLSEDSWWEWTDFRFIDYTQDIGATIRIDFCGDPQIRKRGMVWAVIAS